MRSCLSSAEEGSVLRISSHLLLEILIAVNAAFRCGRFVHSSDILYVTWNPNVSEHAALVD